MGLQELLSAAQSIVFFGGAGVSTESGIPDFRSADGLYNEPAQEYPAEVMLSRSFFDRYPDRFFRFYKEKMICPAAKPNAAHKKLAAWEKRGKVKAVVTQNIDGLHSAAQSRVVWELHGSVLRNYCMDCGAFYGLEYILRAADVPRCDKCGGIVKPDVVLYEEPLSERVVEGAVQAIAGADLLLVAGTSLTVYPAAGLVRYFRGKTLILINRDATPMDDRADLVLRGKVGELLSEVSI